MKSYHVTMLEFPGKAWDHRRLCAMDASCAPSVGIPLSERVLP